MDHQVQFDMDLNKRLSHAGLALIEQNYNRTRSFIIEANRSTKQSGDTGSGTLAVFTEKDQKIEKKSKSTAEGNTHRDFKNEKGKSIDVIENIENMEIERIELDKGEQNINFSGAVHENNILSLLDQDYIEDTFTSYTSLMEHIISSQPTRCSDFEVSQIGIESMQTEFDVDGNSKVIRDMKCDTEIETVQPWFVDLFNLQEFVEQQSSMQSNDKGASTSEADPALNEEILTEEDIEQLLEEQQEASKETMQE
uniref:Uncharacterized protein n=1 Tax=Oryza meridionalis TaxID=40149 RepID=A0A0E0DC11_9ORYZ